MSCCYTLDLENLTLWPRLELSDSLLQYANFTIPFFCAIHYYTYKYRTTACGYNVIHLLKNKCSIYRSKI